LTSMSYLLRHSKFRHVFGEPVKENYSGLNAHSGTPEGCGLAASAVFTAVSLSGGGGSVGIYAHDKACRLKPDHPGIKGHAGGVLDLEFCPFDDHQLATASEDLSVRVWQIPEGGLTEHLTEPIAALEGHQKKVHIVRYSRTASNIIASASHDQTVRLWDLSQGEATTTVAGHTDTIFSICWNYNCSQLVTTCKDKSARIIDPRSANPVAMTWTAHDGAKPSKAVWLGGIDHIATVGFDRQSARSLHLWDPRNLDAPIHTHDMGVGATPVMTMYDDDTKMLYLAPKGDTQINYFEFAENEKTGVQQIFPLSAYAGKKPHKGVCLVPKRGVDPMRCEVARVVRIIDGGLEAVSMIVPRKATTFQEDIYPDTAAPTPALTGEQWLAGENKDPIKQSMKPGAAAAVEATPRTAMKTAFQLQKELEEKDATIAALQKEVAELKLKLGQ